ncbi:OprD family porin [Pseudomonas panipatensis]|uniref:Outer membrane porin, OprD family n=1 Tax=Pseudomonas panipatensis TaxID=428992 RepID=A0A1G8L0G6_9PSED|nr:OprD family porin [Pseudomonas panipatensis]SDI49087.1 outer membrane porin, OprD family [Pseudomonas panipatensis]SMP72889.1 outer membrane porin, OprD family [Pseudomonas panipatensis]
MINKRISLLALGILAASSQAMADGQADAKGFVEDSHLDLFFRNGYMYRDYKQGKQDKSEWGQAASATFTSGFTQGTVGFGVDTFGLYALNLDKNGDRAGAPGIDFFKKDGNGNPAEDLSRLGGALKARFSNTVIKYGDQMPSLPVLSYDNSRLLPESYTGTLITSKEIQGLELNVGRFTEEVQKSATGHDSGGLKRIDVYGGSYKFTDNFSGALYASDNKDVARKEYMNLNYVLPLQDKQSLTFDFNGYKTKLNKDWADDNNGGNRDNTIWSLAATYAFGPHSVMLAHQRNTGDTGYLYGGYQSGHWIGDGGTTIWLANSYWSDFNGEDERSWQASYALDFSEYGVPGLTYQVAYVYGDNIKTEETGNGHEREIFNQLKYVVQSGPAKNLSFKLRGSWLRVSSDARSYNSEGNEFRAFVEYPLNVF